MNDEKYEKWCQKIKNEIKYQKWCEENIKLNESIFLLYNIDEFDMFCWERYNKQNEKNKNK